ncbi:MAG: hypothetical protein AAF798_09590 [Bacteroidota bacterium]
MYRQFVKNKEVADLEALDAENFNIAFTAWEEAFNLAPGADGARDWHFTDGAKFYIVKYKKEADEAKKKEYADKVVELLTTGAKCIEDGTIKIKGVDANGYVGNYMYGEAAYHMYYTLRASYSSAIDMFKTAYAKAGNNTLYTLLEPAATMAAYEFDKGRMDQATTQALYIQIDDIITYNIENNADYGTYYDDTKKRVKAAFAGVEDRVFDCAYFKEDLEPKYREKPEDLDVIRYVYNKLRTQGCDSTDALLQELKVKYETLAVAENERLEKIRREENPCYDAVQLQKEGKYKEAMARYEECLGQPDDAEHALKDDKAKAQIYYSMANIQTWQLGQLGSARTNVGKARSLDSDWGKPYILLGDIYSKLSRGSCDDWNKRLAVLAAIDKYSYAKSIDPSVASDANRRIGNLSASRPDQQEGFMRGVKAGQTVSVGCGIGEKVKVRFK